MNVAIDHTLSVSLWSPALHIKKFKKHRPRCQLPSVWHYFGQEQQPSYLCRLGSFSPSPYDETVMLFSLCTCTGQVNYPLLWVIIMSITIIISSFLYLLHCELMYSQMVSCLWMDMLLHVQDWTLYRMRVILGDDNPFPPFPTWCNANWYVMKDILALNGCAFASQDWNVYEKW